MLAGIFVFVLTLKVHKKEILKKDLTKIQWLWLDNFQRDIAYKAKFKLTTFNE